MNGLVLKSDLCWEAELHGTDAKFEDPLRALNESPNSRALFPIVVPDQTDVYLGVDLGSAQEVTAWALTGLKGLSAGVRIVTLQVGTADNGSTFDIDVASFGEWPADPAYDPEYEPNVLLTFEGVTKRYWRVHFWSNLAVENLYVGGFHLGTALEFAETPASPLPSRFLDHVELSGSMGGGDHVTDTGPAYRREALQWRLLDTADAQDLEDLYDGQEGSTHPVCYVDHLTTHENPYPCRYVTVERFRRGSVGSPTGKDAVLVELQEVT